ALGGLLHPEVRGEVLSTQSQGRIPGLELGNLVSGPSEDRFRQGFRDTAFCLEKIHSASEDDLEVLGNTRLPLIVLSSLPRRRAQNLRGGFPQWLQRRKRV